MQKIMREAIKIAGQLLKKKALSFNELNNIPKNRGVYLIYDKQGKIVWAGKSKNLKGRIRSDHISGEKRFSNSIFRKKLGIKYNILPGKRMRQMIINNYSFAWKEIPDGDKTSLIEALLIAYLRNRKGQADLLND